MVAATDMVAAGALTALHEAGLTVPGDVSLAGYDDIPFARDLHPALTTVHVPYEELGRLAVRTALGRTPEPRTSICCWARMWWYGTRWRQPVRTERVAVDDFR